MAMVRNDAIDTVKGLAIFGVIVIHVKPFAQLQPLGIDSLVMTLLIDTPARFAVPFFFMAAGYLFGRRQTGSGTAGGLAKYSARLAKLYFGWLLLYALYDAALIAVRGKAAGMGGTEVLAELQAYLSGLRPLDLLYYGSGTAGYHLWYLPALLLSTAAVYAADKLRLFGPLLGVSALLYVCGQFGQSYSGLLALPVLTRDALFFGLFYTALGYAFAAGRFAWLRPKRYRIRTLALIGAAALLLQYAERFVMVYVFEGRLGDYWLSTALLSFALFHAVLARPEMGRRSILQRFGRNSAGIYVLHVGVIQVVNLALLAAQLEHVRLTLAWNAVIAPVILVVTHYLYRGAAAGIQRAGMPVYGKRRQDAA